MKDCVEVNGKLHDLAVLVLGKQSVVPLEWGPGGFQSLSGHFGEEENLLLLL